MTSVTPLTRKRVAAQHSTKKDALRSARYAAQRILWRESSLDRVKACGFKLNGECADRVAVKLAGGVAGFSGLQTCGSVHACPVCSQKIMAQRAEDVQAAVLAWHKGVQLAPAPVKGRVVFATFTMRHKKSQSLNELWDALSYAWSKVTSGRAWTAEAELFGVELPREIKTGPNKGQIRHAHRINFVRAVEVTHGRNGWHVHIHALLFVKEAITDTEIDLLGDMMFARWSDALTRFGLEAPTRENGVDVRRVRRHDSKALGDYFTKNVYVGRVKETGAGWEVAGGAGKTARGKNRTPFQILSDVSATGDAEDLELWHEFEAASKGRRQLTWSGSLREVLGLAAEKTDQEIAEEDLGGEVVAEFAAGDWYSWLHRHKPRILELIEAGCDGGQVVAVLLAEIAAKDQAA